MAKETLTYAPLIGSQGKTEYRVRKLQFGDGYSQRAPDGIHIDLREYSLVFRGHVDYINKVKAFFDRHQGVKSFYWKAPDRDEERLFICANVKTTFISRWHCEISVDLEEVVV